MHRDGLHLSPCPPERFSHVRRLSLFPEPRLQRLESSVDGTAAATMSGKKATEKVSEIDAHINKQYDIVRRLGKGPYIKMNLRYYIHSYRYFIVPMEFLQFQYGIRGRSNQLTTIAQRTKPRRVSRQQILTQAPRPFTSALQSANCRGDNHWSKKMPTKLIRISDSPNTIKQPNNVAKTVVRTMDVRTTGVSSPESPCIGHQSQAIRNYFNQVPLLTQQQPQVRNRTSSRGRDNFVNKSFVVDTMTINNCFKNAARAQGSRLHAKHSFDVNYVGQKRPSMTCNKSRFLNSHSQIYIYVQYIFIARSSQLYFIIQLSCPIILSEYTTAKLNISFFIYAYTSHYYCGIPILSTRLELCITRKLRNKRSDDCATRFNEKVPVSTDDVYQGQIRMDRLISSSPAVVNTCSVNVGDRGETFGCSQSGQSSKSCRSENHARSPDATVHQVQRRIRTQPVKIERSVLQGASHHSVPLRPFFCDATEDCIIICFFFKILIHKSTKNCRYIKQSRIDMGFLKLLLNIGLILAMSFGINGNFEIIRRLSVNTIPIHYNIKLIPYLEEDNSTFHGESNVEIIIYHASQSISLHSRELEINERETTLINDKGTVYKPMEHIHDNVTNILTLNFKNTLSPGFYILNLKFVGILSEVGSVRIGFMKFPYINNEGNKMWIAATQFEPNGARRMFPCWDEPALKATFNISVTHHQKYMALSNMPIREQFKKDDFILTHFNTTPIMSTYLVAIVIISMLDFTRVSNADETINIWCNSSLASGIQLAYVIAQRITPLLIEYTNSSEKVSKMNHVIIPNFPIYGMENWGLIIYSQESGILYDEIKQPHYKATGTAMLVTHEIIHQWFGNLVTPSWWSYQWLKEGLAMFIQSYILDNFKFGAVGKFQVNFVIMASNQYCLLEDNGSMNSVTLKLNNTLEDGTLFSNEVYVKAFDKSFFKFSQFNSTTPDDLWSTMQSALDESDVPHEDYKIKEVMDTWMNQDRYPIVNVKKNYETGEVTISQICFQKFNETITNKWWIPVTFATQSNPNFSNTMPRYWLRPDQNISFTINSNDWIILNLQQTGYYRVNYDIRNWYKISNYLHTRLRMIELFDRLLLKIGYEENPHDDDLTIVTRVDVLKFACIFGHVKCKAMATVKLNKHLERPKIHKIRHWQKFVFCSGLMTANKTTWDKMLKLYLKKNYKTEKYQKKLLKSLSCAENPDIIINYLNITAFNTSLFHDKEHSLVFMYIIENHARNDLILDYVLNNFEIIKPK
ncbi:AMPQ Aminopeptidase, partial [Acromyrmex heyeri]